MKRILLRLTLLLAVTFLSGSMPVSAASDGSVVQPVSPSVRPAETVSEMYAYKSPMGIRYTKKHPLIIVAAWGFRPYSFYNDHGDPDGFLIDIVRHLFNIIHIPYEIHMMDVSRARREMAEGRAHLMLEIIDEAEKVGGLYSYTLSIPYNVGVMRLSTSPKIPSLMQLTETDSVYTCFGMYEHKQVNRMTGGNPRFYLGNLEPIEAFRNIVNGSVPYYMWNKNALLAFIQKYGMEGRIVVDDIEIPSTYFCLSSTDRLLLLEFEEHYSRLRTSGVYQQTYDKWFVNGGQGHTANMADILAIVVFVLIFVALFLAYILFQRTGGSSVLRREFQTIADVGLDLTSSQLLALRLSRQWIQNLSSTYLPHEGLSLDAFLQLIHLDDRESICQTLDSIDSVELEIPILSVRMLRYDDASATDWRTMHIHGFVSRTMRGTPDFVYLVLIDETDRIAERLWLDRSLKELANVSSISDLAVACYDAEGQFVSGNASLFHLFEDGGLRSAENYFHGSTLRELSDILNGFTFLPGMHTLFCASISKPDLNLRLDLEVKVSSVYDRKGNFCEYVVGFYDLRPKMDVRRRLRSQNHQQLDLSGELARYQMEMRFVLHQNNIRTLRWRRGNDYLELSTDLLNFSERLPLADYLGNVGDQENLTLDGILNNPEKSLSHPLQMIRKYRVGNSNIHKWYAIYTTPDYDDNGDFIGIFGIRHDITAFVDVQELLREETLRANDSERQKSVFLANMTHELRTPLNAISGFAELLMVMPDEKAEYVSIMQHNCRMLISLVDNILQLSVIDTDGLTLERYDVDFARRFPDAVERLSHYVTNPEVQFLVDAPLPTLFINIDFSHVMQIVEAFVSNASKNTTKGYVKVGFSYDDHVLSVYCSDTGCGIAPDKQKHVFDRFYKVDAFMQGSGLGLSVCYEIARSLGGSIDVQSVLGEGSTFTLRLPM